MEQNFNKKGQPAKGEDKVFAYLNNGSQQIVAKVLTYNNLLYDPLGADSNRENNLDTKLRKVDAKVFGSYVKYLQTNNKLFFTHAQRLFNNG